MAKEEIRSEEEIVQEKKTHKRHRGDRKTRCENQWLELNAAKFKDSAHQSII